MKIVIAGLAVLILLIPVALVVLWLHQAGERHAAIQNEQGTEATQQVAVAAAADEQYCTPELKRILRRVLQSCGLVGSGGGRGCQPADARNVATMAGDDFNALFVPMQQRGAIIQFDRDSAELDQPDTQLVDQVFADQRGASYYFVVSRSSPEGNAAHNTELSKRRAEAVLTHLRSTFNDPDLDKEVGLLWLGEEFAQLNQSFCNWRRSAQGQCSPEELNRSAFVAWIDCRL